VAKAIRDTARVFWNVGFRRLQSPDNGRIVVLSDIVPIRLGVVAPLDTRIQFVAEGTADLFVGARTPNTSFGAEDPLDMTFGFRAFLTRYLHLSAGYRRNVNQGGSDKNGFVFLVGYNYGPPPMAPPPPPPTLTCTGDPAQVEAGQPVRLSAMGVSSTGAPLTYTWTTTGGTIQGTGAMVTLQTTGLAAGTYTATVRASEASGAPSADCNVTITVRQPPPPPPPPPARPPTVTLRLDRPRVQVGEIVNAIATGNSPDNRPLTYQWSVTPSGQVQGTGANVRIDTTGMQPGNYTVTVRVTDDRNLSSQPVSAQFAVDAPPPPPPPPQVSKLDECLFRRNSARVDNVCKAKLDNVALRLMSEPDATLAIVGYSERNETNAAQLAQNRANNVRTYLTQDKGIAAGRLAVRTGRGAVGAEYRRVDLYLVPRGATFTGASVFEKLPGTPLLVAHRSVTPKTVATLQPANRVILARAR
jgi:outer membrane protein OmpA-like peptidoglycan-associated protein